MGNQTSKHNQNQDNNNNNKSDNNNVDERVLNEMKESLDSDKNGANNEEISKVPPMSKQPEAELETSANIISSDIPVGDSPTINPNDDVQQEVNTDKDTTNLPPAFEISDDSNTQLVVDSVNEELLSAMKVENDEPSIAPPADEKSVPLPSIENNDNNDNNGDENSNCNEDKAEGNENIPSPPITRERFQTKAEAELLSLFNNTPIVDITITSNATQQNEETIEEILAQNFFNDQNNFYYQDVPKSQKSMTLSRKIYNTLTRKKSRKASDGYSTVVNKSQTTGDIASLSRLDDNDGEGSSNLNNNNNINSNINNNINDRKYNTISMKMSTFRKKLFHSQQDLHSNTQQEQQEQQVTEASDENGKGTDDKKKKKFFSSTELSNLGSMFSREMGHVFLLSPSGPSYCSYTTSGF